MSVFVVGDIILDQLLSPGDGSESLRDHFSRKAAETSIRSAYRYGGATLTLSLLEALGIDVSCSPILREKDGQWWTSAVSKNTGHRIARQTISLMHAPMSSGSKEVVERARRMMALEYIDAPGALEFCRQIESAQKEGLDIVLIEDLDLGGYESITETVESADEAADKLTLVKTTRPLRWLGEVVGSNTKKPVTIVSGVNNFFLGQGGIRGSWDALVRNVNSELKEFREKPNWSIVLICENEGLLFAGVDANTGPYTYVAWDRRAPLGSMADSGLGWVPGSQNVFVAALAQEVLNGKDSQASWTCALAAWRRLRSAALLGVNLGADAAFDIDRLFGDLGAIGETVKDYKQTSCSSDVHDPEWNMFTDRLGEQKGGVSPDNNGLVALAVALVERGPSILMSTWPRGYRPRAKEFADSVPILAIGHLISFAGKETEELTVLARLIRDYAQRTAVSRPLSIAVFGAPGSGKSFAVDQILSHMRIQSEKLTYNLSQFSEEKELRQAMQSIQTAGLRERLPVVFWDEFDTSVGDKPMGWLRHFLSPMQDGNFSNNGHTHAIGKAIFVFAGGTCHSSEAFFNPKAALDKEEEANQRRDKLPDFASRLKAVYNVPSVEFTRSNTDKITLTVEHSATLLRRALIVRHCLLKHAPTVQQVSTSVLEGMLASDEHETARDIENVIESAPLASASTFGEAHLPKPIFPGKAPVRLNVDFGKADNVRVYRE